MWFGLGWPGGLLLGSCWAALGGLLRPGKVQVVFLPSSFSSVLYFYFEFRSELIFYHAGIANLIHTRVSPGYYNFLSGVFANLI
jgi:hypothetical protein